MLGHRPVEEVNAGIDHFLGLHQLEGIEGFLVDPAVGEGLGIGQPQVVPIESRPLAVLDYIRDRHRRRLCWVARLGQ